MEIKRLLFVLCAVIIGRAAEQNGTTLDPLPRPPTHTPWRADWVEGICVMALNGSIRDFLEHVSGKSQTWLCSGVVPSDSSEDPALKSLLYRSLCSALKCVSAALR